MYSFKICMFILVWYILFYNASKHKLVRTYAVPMLNTSVLCKNRKNAYGPGENNKASSSSLPGEDPEETLKF